MPQLRSNKANNPEFKEEIEFVSTSGQKVNKQLTSGSDEEEFILSDAYSLVEVVSGSENGDDELEISQENFLEDDDTDENLDVNNSKTGKGATTS